MPIRKKVTGVMASGGMGTGRQPGPARVVRRPPPPLVETVIEITATGAFAARTIPATAIYYQVQAYGAGGGGGGGVTSGTGGGHGGSGGFADTGLTLNDGAPKLVTGSVGAGGTGSVSGSVATAGGTTTAAIGPFSLTASGGDRGRNYSESSGVGGAGGTATGGAVNITGGTGPSSAAGRNFAIGGDGGLGYPGRGIPANQQEPQGLNSTQSSGNNGQAGAVVIRYWERNPPA